MSLKNTFSQLKTTIDNRFAIQAYLLNTFIEIIIEFKFLCL